MDPELEKRVIQTLKDMKPLLYSWQKQTDSCEDCKKLSAETAPLMKGLNGLLKELGVEK